MTLCVLSCVGLFATHWTLGCSPQGSSVHGIFPKRILDGVAMPPPGDLHTQGSNKKLLHWRQILYHLIHQGSSSTSISISIYIIHTHTHTHNIACEKGLCCAKSLQLCPTLCDSMDYIPPCSSVHRILQARIMEWVAMPFSKEISPTLGLNLHLLCLLHWQACSLPLAPPFCKIFRYYQSKIF